MAVASNGSGSPNGFKKFFEQNKTLVFLFPLLLILVIVVVIIYIPKGGDPADSIPVALESTPSNQVEVLPQTERVTGENSETGTAGKKDATGTEAVDQSLKDPFVGPMTFTGVLLDDNGNNIAVIEGKGKTFIVRKGDMIGDSILVDSIGADEVLLKEGNRTIQLKLEQKKNGQTGN